MLVKKYKQVEEKTKRLSAKKTIILTGNIVSQHYLCYLSHLDTHPLTCIHTLRDIHLNLKGSDNTGKLFY